MLYFPTPCYHVFLIWSISIIKIESTFRIQYFTYVSESPPFSVGIKKDIEMTLFKMNAPESYDIFPGEI